jgi:aspartate-semialdehyde dehydrogenase
MTNPKWILSGADTLLGRELRDYIPEHHLPVRLVLAGGTAADRVLTAAGEDEISVMEPLSAETLHDAAVLLLAGTDEEARAACTLARGLPLPPAIVDLTGTLEGEPGAVVRAPLLESGQAATPAGAVDVVAHPAATGLGRLLDVIHAAHPLRHAIATLLEPVSAHGAPGIDELHKQTLSLFNFQNPPKDLFDTQASFNLLPRFGEEAKVQPGHSEARIERHLALLLAPRGVPAPSLRVLHAPVFHGYGLSVWVEFESRPAVAHLEKELEAAGVDVRRAGMEPASNTGVAGQGGITVSDLAVDPRHGGGMWLWMMLDNLRTTVETAVLVAAAASRARESA